MELSNKILAIFPLQILAMLTYIPIAKKINLFDVPNERSSHKNKVIRGGGVIIPVSIILYSIFFGLHNYYIIGILLASLISFIDDITPINAFVRLGVHFVSVGFIFMDINTEVNYSPIIVILVSVIAVAAVNSYNFMDGINGMTGLYTITIFETIFFYNYKISNLFDSNLIILLTVAILIFSFYNFKTNAIMFAGDVGSVSLGLIAVFYVLFLIVHTHSILYLSILAVYGVESGMTILHRIFKGQNIFQAHRMHLFQDLVNIVGVPHIQVSLYYSIVQIIINIGMFMCIKCQFPGYLYFIYITLVLIAAYTIIKFYINNNSEKFKNEKD